MRDDEGGFVGQKLEMGGQREGEMETERCAFGVGAPERATTACVWLTENNLVAA